MGAITAELVEAYQKRDSKGRKVIQRERRLELIEGYRSSGMTMAGFAKREGITYSTFAGWMQRAAREGNGAIRFAEVKVPEGAPAPIAVDELEVRFVDGTVLRGGDATKLAMLIKALRG